MEDRFWVAAASWRGAWVEEDLGRRLLPVYVWRARGSRGATGTWNSGWDELLQTAAQDHELWSRMEVHLGCKRSPPDAD